jgi:hypothetical protein
VGKALAALNVQQLEETKEPLAKLAAEKGDPKTPLK